MVKKSFFIIMVLTIIPFFVFPVSIGLSHYYKGALVHLFNHTCSGVKVSSCPLSEKQKQIRLFGYDVGIEYHEHQDDRFFKPHERAILYLHPWGILALPNKKHAHLLKMYNVIPGDAITFNFPDGAWRSPFPALYSTFGQLSDVLPALYTLNYAYEAYGIRAVDLYGYSRGGSVAVNMIAVLNDEAYDTILSEIGISALRKKELLSIIENGSLVLDCPLIDGNETLKAYSYPVQFLAQTCTRFQAGGLQALKSAQSLSGLSLRVLIHFQHNDTRVGNHNEAEFYNAFARRCPNDTYLVMGNDGGHVHTHQSLAAAIHLFYKRVGAAYDTKCMETEKMHKHRAHDMCGKLLQPHVNESENIISSFHRLCETS